MPPSDLELDFSAPSPPQLPADTRDIYTPSRLNREARTLLERGLPALWLEGEISNLSRPSSGHWYFSLKDEAAQLRCAMFRQRNILAKFTPRDGSHVLVRGRVSLYEQRGDYQFIADYMEEAGEGALRQRFELLKVKLAAQGLFAIEHKRPLPRLPRRIGVVTSPTGAAIRDVLHILKRRFCGIPVLLYPVQVQGGVAAAQIARTIRRASARAECDVLILVRGGGSLEDLWAFNEESVARAIYDSAIPIVTGIGHEVDFTIADFVADVRAPTPSGAAELVVPDSSEWLRNVVRIASRLTIALSRKLKTQQDRASWLARRLQQLHPGVELRQRAQRLDDLEQRLIRILRANLSARQRTLVQLAAELRQHSPSLRVANARRRLDSARASIETITRARIEQFGKRIAVAARTLDAVSPLATLERGYAIVTDSKGKVVTNAQDVRAGQLIDARLTQGSIRARVERATNPELDLRLPGVDEK
jgi:exodeoxyribonuclease VII large subunit